MKPVTRDELVAAFASFFGMDGGNPYAPLWICGIEHGGKADGYTEFKVEDKPGAWDLDRRQACAGEIRKWPYWRNLSKIIVETAREVMQPPSAESVLVPSWRTYRDHYLHSSAGWDFKLNLFPLNCSSVSAPEWFEQHGHQPLLADIPTYRQICREGGRFDFMRKQVKRFRPKLILGTGVQFKKDFECAFGFEDYEEREVPVSTNSETRTLYVRQQRQADGTTTTLVICPFPGAPSGLNSNALLNELSRKLAHYVGASDFAPLLEIRDIQR
ncbi:hypothetical protein ACRS8P_00845 [Burkholderia cenocepacia]